MGQSARTFRIFVSSTFSDLKAERNALQKYAFPRLRDLCMRHGCRFQAIDLRWGVREEAALDQQTMRICLEEIARCQRVTAKPNFIVLLGDRYGWRPLPFAIPADEFEAIEARISNANDKALVHRWYKRDDNAVPAVWDLQPREGEFKDSARWEPVERQLRTILIAATADFAPDKRLKYFASATEQEIVLGAMDVADAADHVFGFFRTVPNLPHDTTAKDFIDLQPDEAQASSSLLPAHPRGEGEDEGSIGAVPAAGSSVFADRQINSEARDQLRKLQERLRSLLPGNIHDYEASWQDGAPTTDHIGTLPADLDECLTLNKQPDPPQTLCVDVWRRLSQVILDQVAKIKAEDALDREARNHAEFGKTHTHTADGREQFVGREDVLRAIDTYIKDVDRHPLVMHGESGSGKTAVIARATEQCETGTGNGVIVRRFIGATPGSSDGRSLIEGLCREISRRYGANDSDVPADYQELIGELPKRLALATSTRRLVLFLDALDQLSDADHARNLAWLPRELPEHVRLIVTTVPGDCLDTLQRKLPGTSFVTLDVMRREEAAQLLNLWLDEDQPLRRRTLQSLQRDEVLNAFAQVGFPLYLRLACEEARRWKSYPRPTDKALRASVDRIIHENLLGRLSAEHGAPLVSRALGYLCAAGRGLSEDEMLDVLSSDTDVFTDFRERAQHDPPEPRLPVIVWSRLYFDLEPYLTERDAYGTPVLNFYHRQFGEVAAAAFLNGDARAHAHSHLAEYFQGQDYFRETLDAQRTRARTAPPTPRPVNVRKVDELPWQRLEVAKLSKQWEELEGLFTELPFVEAKAEAGMVFELVTELTAATLAVPRERPQQGILALADEAIRHGVHSIARHPTTLFQCLWNTCWWYDCPEVARHYEEPQGGWPQPPPWERAGPKLHEVLEDWRRAKEAATPGFLWLRSHGPPLLHLGTAQRRVLHGHENDVTSVALSADGTTIVSGSLDGTVRVWDAASGAERRVLRGHEGTVTSVALSADGATIVSGSLDKTVRVWDAASGAERRVLRGHERYVTNVALSADGATIVSGSLDGTVRVWDAARGAERRVLCSHEGGVNSVTLSADGATIVGALGDTVRVWDAVSGAERRVLGHKHTVFSVAVSVDGTTIVSGSYDWTVRVWDATSGAERRVLRGHEREVTSVALSGDCTTIVSSSYDETVRVWDAASGAERRALRRHEDRVTSLAVSADGTTIVGALDNTVRVWDAASGAERRVLRGHKLLVRSVAVSADDATIVSGSWDNTVRVWNAASGAERWVLRGHNYEPICVTLSVDGTTIVSGSLDKTVRVWDGASGTGQWVLRGHEEPVTSVAMSCDGMTIISGSYDKTVRVWDAASGAQRRVLRGHGEPVTTVALSVDGTTIVSGSDDKTVRVWDAASGEERRVLRGHEGSVSSVAVSADGTTIVSGSADRTVRVWNVASGEERRVLRGHKGVQRVALSADGTTIVSRSPADQTIRVWDAATGECREVIQGTGDVEAIAAGPSRFPFRALRRGLETVIEDAATAAPVAWFPVPLDHISTFPNGRAWVGTSANHLYIITLEGGEGGAKGKL